MKPSPGTNLELDNGAFVRLDSWGASLFFHQPTCWIGIPIHELIELVRVVADKYDVDV